MAAMPRIDEGRPFLPVNIAILTVSNTRTEADDKSGNTLAELHPRRPTIGVVQRAHRQGRSKDSIIAQRRAPGSPIRRSTW